MALPMRPMGSQGLVASMQGFGCMGLTAFYGTAFDEDAGVAVLEAAFKLGVTHFDSAEMYVGKNAAGEERYNEALVGAFLKKVGRDKVTFATKYWPAPEKADCTEEQVRASVEASLARLQEPSIDLYYLHRIPGNPDALKNFMEAGKKLVAEGKVKYLGLSEATPEEIRLAHSIHPLTAVQQEWSLVVRSLEAGIVPVCKELGIAVVAYSPLCRGLTSALVKKDEDWSKIGHEGGAAKGFQSLCPHLTGENLSANVKLLEPLEEEAGKLGVTPAELSLAWLHAHGGDLVFPIPGTTKVANLEKNVNGAKLSLTLPADVVAKIGAPGDSLAALAGTRYPAGFYSTAFESKGKA
mmetsp:Transcript_36901/g.80953  ORF Transcript_36901/g.80953 Transcript_36901/m.80953 type:complete len:352 (-) Transcript_36901:132-1187(-)|eukprot:CAMPEP_0170594392 /NCGR_PEP_ID=MMETSP0224-20130122/13977_1 /TAXON_ID=285029 /ORGANISM="Togula jolla, Strain CCCM 725" /LENGTH=351 /DNA_ID=CAMNT_0010918449 /DNA_START=86 /DNA_END=1141 /DNA_ORIENTATION=+